MCCRRLGATGRRRRHSRTGPLPSHNPHRRALSSRLLCTRSESVSWSLRVIQQLIPRLHPQKQAPVHHTTLVAMFPDMNPHQPRHKHLGQWHPSRAHRGQLFLLHPWSEHLVEHQNQVRLLLQRARLFQGCSRRWTHECQRPCFSRGTVRLRGEKNGEVMFLGQLLGPADCLRDSIGQVPIPIVLAEVHSEDMIQNHKTKPPLGSLCHMGGKLIGRHPTLFHKVQLPVIPLPAPTEVLVQANSAHSPRAEPAEYVRPRQPSAATPPLAASLWSTHRSPSHGSPNE